MWVYETVRKHRVGGPPPRVNRHRLIDTPAFTPSEYRQILADFRVRLDSLVDYCERIGAVPILVIPPGNESGFEPNRSVISARVSAAEREELADRFQQYLSVEKQDPRQSMEGYRSILDEHPDFAEAHFRLGRLLESAQAYDEARSHYIQARDLDGYPVRCMTPFMEIYRDVAARHACILVDGPQVLRRKPPRDPQRRTLARRPPPCVQEPFLSGSGDHGPAFRAEIAGPGSSFNQRLRDRHRSLRSAFPDRLECLVDGLHQVRRLLLASGRGSLRAIGARAKELRFMQAGRDLKAGIRSAEEVGVPGIGLTTNRSYPWDWWIGRQDAGSAQTALH